MHVQNLGYPLVPLKIKQPKTTNFRCFRRLRNLQASLKACTFGVKHNIDNWRKALKTTRSSLQSPVISWTSIEHTPKLMEQELSRGIQLLHCQASHITTRTQSNFATTLKIAWGQQLYFWSFFDAFEF